MNPSAAPPASAPASGEFTNEQGERTEPRRGRRGRRRGRRGGGGSSRSTGASDAGNSNAPPREESRPQQGNAGGNGSRPTEEVHVEPRESVAHFEPSVPAGCAIRWATGPTVCRMVVGACG